MQQTHYLDVNIPSRVTPSSPLEVDVLRQALLADRFVIHNELPTPLECLEIEQGGRLFYDPQWSAELIMHYTVGEHLKEGVFELAVKFYSRQTGQCLGALQLGCTLNPNNVPHDVQTRFYPAYWRRSRSTFLLPHWFVLPNREPSPDLQIKTHDKATWRLLAFEDIHHTTREYRDSLPHVVLVDPEKPTAAT